MSVGEPIRSWSMMAMSGVRIACSASGVSFVAAEPPAPSPTVQEEKATTSDSGGVQDRGIRQMPPGGMTTAPLQSSGFSCDPKTKVCTCRKGKAGDCDLMKIFCTGSTFNCPGSSQTCTCTAFVR